MLMLNHRRKSILSLFLFGIIFLTILSSTNSIALPEPVVDEPVLYTKSSDDIGPIQTRALLDSENRTHYFVQISYYNGTFVILHIFNDEIKIIERDFYATYTFEAQAVGDGIYLFYSLSGQFYGTILKLYKWTEEFSETDTIFTSLEYHASAYFLQEDNNIHLLYIDENWETNSIIYHKILFPNGSVRNRNYDLPFTPYYLRSLVISNGELFGLIQYTEYVNFKNYIHLVVAGFNEGGYYNSTVISLEMDWVESELAVGTDDKFHLSLVSFGNFYSAEFDVNETISLSSFVSTSLEDYYMSQYHIFSYENATYYVFDGYSDVYYLEDISKRRSSYTYSITARITIITEFGGNFTSERITLARGVESYSFYSASAYILENGSYLISYTSSISTKEISKYHFLGKSIIAMNLYSDLPLSYPEQPILFSLKDYSAFAYFWLKNWYAFAIPIIVLGLNYAIFHKRINRAIRKLKAFLLRPIIADASKTKLVFTNLWLFFLNASSLILVLWRTNKKRLVINLLGFTILATIIIASTSLYDSKRNSLVYDYISNYNIYDNGLLPVTFSIPSSGVTIEELSKNITETAIEEIVNSIKRNTILFSRIITGFHYSLSSPNVFQMDERFGTIENYGYTESYNPVLESLLEGGNLPTNRGEVLIPSNVASDYHLNVNDVISSPFSNKNFTIKGIFTPPSYSVLSSLCDEYSLPRDPIAFLTDYFSVLTPMDYYFEIFENVTNPTLNLFGRLQLIYDFSDISPNEISVLNEELETIQSRSPYAFSLLPQSFWSFWNEFSYAFYGIETTLATAQILILFILVPIIYLAWFLIFEVNELFGLSFEQEIRILRSKGVSTGNISFIYLSMKTLEAIISAVIGFLITLALLPPLLRVDKFIEFQQTPARISFTSIPISISLTLVLLLVISFPRIIRMSKSEKRIQKTPRRLVRLLKNLRLNYIFIIILGGIVAGIGFWLFSIFAFDFGISGLASFALMFIYLMGIGVMIALLGVGLLMKDLHKILMIVLSKISWRARKSKFSLSLVDVRSDINLFNNTFLTYVIIIGIIMPFILSPIAIQTKIQNETLLYGGSDLYIKNWQNLDSDLLDQLKLYNEIDSLSNITVYHNYYGSIPLYTLVYNNLEDYLSSSFKPPKYYFEDWEERVQETDSPNTMMVSKPFYVYVAKEESNYTFSNDTLEFTFTISSTFTLYPIFYDKHNIFFTNEYYFVTNMDNYKKLNESTHDYLGHTIDRLLIKLKPLTNQIKFAEQLEKELNIDVESTEEEADVNLIRDFPFYSLMAAEFVFGILICLIAIIFTSLSNPIKILQRRITKHDVLKKIGIPSNSIILITGLELLISAILPGLILGGVAGYGLVRLTGFLMLSFTYSALPYVIPYPFPIMLLIFFGIPILFYSIFFIAMKINFVRFKPRNLE